MKRDQIIQERLNALIDLLESDGSSKPGDLPPVEYLRGLKSVRKSEESRELKQAHKEGRGPPDWAGPPGQNDSPGQGQGGRNE